MGGNKKKNVESDEEQDGNDDDDVVMKDQQQDQSEDDDQKSESGAEKSEEEEDEEKLEEVDDPADEDHDEDDEDEEEEKEDAPRRRGGRAASKGTKKYTDNSKSKSKSKSKAEDSATEEASESEEEESEAEESEESSESDDEEEIVPTRRRGVRDRRNSADENKKKKIEKEKADAKEAAGKRRSGRSTKFKASMKDPTESQGLIAGDSDSDSNDSYDSDNGNRKKISKSKAKAKPKAKPKKKASPVKSHRHSTSRRSNRKSALEVDSDDDDDDDDDGGDEDSDVYMEEEYSEDDASSEEEEEKDETLKIQRILAVRSETRKRWKEICSKMQSSEVTDGSRWYQPSSESKESSESAEESEDEEDKQDDKDDADKDKDQEDKASSNKSSSSKTDKDNNIIEERFLVKWNILSYMHVSWETQHDLIDQCDNAKQYISTFFRKQDNGYLFTSDERKDGDYFDPGLVQIDRILEIVPPDGFGDNNKKNKKVLPTDWLGELALQENILVEHGIVLDNKTDPKAFESGAGRQFLMKWSSLNYNEMSYEFERDIILCDQHDLLKEKLKEYYERTKKPTRKELQAQKKSAEESKRRSYLLFGDNSRKSSPKEKEIEVKQYQEQLCDHVYLNGGSLRDYQAEGVTWFLANFINRRSCIMADEMGLGKTLQTAAFIHLLVEKMYQPGPFLIVVPLSTLAHWQREFIGWTGLNTIVYHGSAEDRKKIREHEFAFEKDRPDNPGWGVNSLYLKKCEPAKKASAGYTQWMASVVITTPEMLVADDWTELSYVKWSVLVVDEAHRLKNHNSKLALNMRKEQFKFQHKILLTGTPIQNDVKEFWTLLNFIDPENYDDVDEFLEEYGDMKSKEKIDDLHEKIRPYILRRLKEDVEKSVPPKEETLIEVELTLSQKQYYRALYEKNVGFLHKNKKKALDGPSLNNLAMQLRKCCNHLFLLNGVEQDMRDKEKLPIEEGDFLAGGSGKLVLLDKLLPRLKTDGHRVLIFSQFKIMLDILEDYLNCRDYTFERIDGSITGNKRQSAIDRYQDSKSKDPPFVMLLSTRAGGVGINLTAADTCVIFDSDWNPQNDIQAMARCHRIGQTKNVKVYRLLTRKTYEMQMFHMSSLKMGLDQAVLTGFESSSSSGEGAMTKEEVEKLLRVGAYDIFNEDKAGTAEAESNDFKEQDIESILSRRSRKVVHDNTGSGSAAAGGTFSKASFINKTPSKTGDTSNGQSTEDIDINDPDFWTKMVGEAKPEEESILKPRKRNQANYNEENLWDKNMKQALKFDADGEAFSESDESDGEDSDESAEDPSLEERYRWGGPGPDNWKKDQVESVLESIEQHGYGMIPWDQFFKSLSNSCDKFSQIEVHRMSWSLVLIALCEVASSQGSGDAKRSKAKAERKRESRETDGASGDGLAEQSNEVVAAPKSDRESKENAFKKIWELHSCWATPALEDVISFARGNTPRTNNSDSDGQAMIRDTFKQDLWPSLLSRGWKVENEDDEEESETYIYEKRKFTNPSQVMNDVMRIHPELQNMVLPLLKKIEQSKNQVEQQLQQEKMKDLSITAANLDLKSLQKLLERYSPKQLLHDRHKTGKKISLRIKLLSACYYAKSAIELVKAVDGESSTNNTNAMNSTKKDKLVDMVGVDARSGLPHPLWTRKHDALLIRSVAKHGWVDIDSNLKRIVNDKDIKWGFPFEASDDAAPIEHVDENDQANLRQTAERAAAILNDKHDILEVLTGFNKKLVIDSYGLTQDVDEDAMDEGKKKWKVDESLLNQANNKKSESTTHEAVDLPAKKDFVKRAKYVIVRTIASLRTGGTNNKAISSTKTDDDDIKGSESHGYIMIDQGNRCNILLAELVRGVVKGSTKNAVQLRNMWEESHTEATLLRKMLAPQEDKKKETEELSRIMNQIAHARQASKRATTQAKNILRVMLGEKPLAPRNQQSGDIMDIFPPERKASTQPSTSTAAGSAAGSSNKAKAAPKKKVKKNDPPLGEKAIVKAMKKAQDHHSGKDFTFLKDKDDLGLQLTMIETYILSAFCSEGMPLVSESKNSGGGSSVVTKEWKDVSGAIEVIARHQLQQSKEKITHCKQALTKGTNQKLDKEKIEALASNLSRAESDYANREEAARLAADFTSGPDDRLSKKSIMLMEKVRSYGASSARPNGKNATSPKYDNYLGARVSSWFKKELARIAANYDILDDENKPQSWTTADICKSIEGNPEYNKMIVSALLDKTSARQVTSQIALISRLRSILIQHTEKDFRLKLQRAMKQCKRADDEWERKPEWWDDSSDEHAFLLLKKLNDYGFTKIMTLEKARDGFGLPNKDYDDMADDLKLTKPSIQIKANQLIRELHIIEDHDSMIQMVAKRRKSSQNHNFDSLASCNNDTNNNNNNDNGQATATATDPSSAKKSTVQTGLKAFFTAASSKKKTPSPNNNNTARTSIGSNGSKSNSSKRKESPSPLGDHVIGAIIGNSSSGGGGGASGSGTDETTSPPAEKKIKTTTPTTTPEQQQQQQQQQQEEVVQEEKMEVDDDDDDHAGKKSNDAIVIE